jgi:hypothetical protein
MSYTYTYTAGLTVFKLFEQNMIICKLVYGCVRYIERSPHFLVLQTPS